MTATELVERLRGYPLLETVPLEQLSWMATRGHLERIDKGVTLDEWQVVERVYFLLRGRVVLYVRRGEQRRKIIEWRDGEFFGALPYSRMVAPPGNGMFVEPSEVVIIDRTYFPEMIRDCHELTAIMVHVMVDRARIFNTADLHDERMVSLGKLAAGLAHELNNPASAIVRSAGNLTGRLVDADEAARDFGAAGLTETQIATVDAVREGCLAERVHGIRSPIEQADREDEITDWLADHGVDAALAESLAGSLAETPITLEGLERLAGALVGEELELAIRWVSHSCSARSLALEIAEAASRIHTLVGAVKGFTHMDRARIPQPVDVGQGLSNTLTMLEGKARERKVGVRLDLAPDLPQVQGFAAELNQVWMNLIDNAIDAVPAEGRVEVTAVVEGGKVVVRVSDSGAGIPEGVLPHIFDPFFTTKSVGQGTGLGLDVVRRLIQEHEGEIGVESRPGHTEFRVGLPIGEVAAGGTR